MRRFWFPLIALAVGWLIYWYSLPGKREDKLVTPRSHTGTAIPTAPASPSKTVTSAASQAPEADHAPTPAEARPTLASPPPHMGNRMFYGELPEGVRSLKELPMGNRPSPQWKSRLVKHLRVSGGEQLKELRVEPQESYIILHGTEGLYVERAVVTIDAKDGRHTSFFAEVDSQSGHVLKSWGASIPENPVQGGH